MVTEATPITAQRMGSHLTGEEWRDYWQSPPSILKIIHTAARYYGMPFYDVAQTPEEREVTGFDAFESPWPSGKTLYINPMFSEYDRWGARGVEQLDRGEPMVQIWICHTNNSTGWFKNLVKSSYCQWVGLLDRRVFFIDPRTGEPSKNSAIGKSQSLICLSNQEALPYCNGSYLPPCFGPEVTLLAPFGRL